MTTINAVGNGLAGTTGAGAFVGQNGPTLNDANGLPALTIQNTSNQVNYIQIQPRATGSGPVIASVGSDPNINLDFVPAGGGSFQFLSSNPTNPVVITNGTSAQHITNFIMANTSATRSVTFPDASGTIQLSGASTFITAPAASAAASLSLGSAYQNVAGYDVIVTVYLAVASATTASILSGVGPTNTPTQQTIVSSLSLAALNVIPVTLYIPNNYYALLSTSGTISVTISGQQTMAV